jgi:hypothetical protein
MIAVNNYSVKDAIIYGLATGGLVGSLNELSSGIIGNTVKISVAMIIFFLVLSFFKKK